MLNTKIKATVVASLSIASFLNAINSAPVNPVVSVSDIKVLNVKPNPINKVGNPYVVNGITYIPKEYSNYEVVSFASWYGDEFHGKLTANGEVYDKYELTAAHPTLPLPSFVEVTNLDNGKKVIVRVNDRGPFVAGRDIDVSERAAEILGFKETGTAKVKIRLVTLEDAKNQLKNMDKVMAQTSTNQNSVQPTSDTQNSNAGVQNTNAPKLKGVTAEETPVTSSEVEDAEVRKVGLQEPTSVRSYIPRGVFVQIGAFSSDADKLKKDVVSLSDMGVVSLQKVDLDGKSLLRLRVGPYGSIDDAIKIKNKLNSLGYGDSRVVVEQ